MIDPLELDLAPELGTKTYRIGLIGTGAIVTQSHLPAYRSQGWEVVRIASRSTASAERVAADFGIPRYSGDYMDVLRDPEVEVVDISFPPHLQRPICEAAFAAGKHVLVQKPMAIKLGDARAIVGAAREAGVKLAVNQNGRWDPAIRACKELMKRDVFGRVITASFELRTRQPWQKFWEDKENYPRLMLVGMSIHHLDQFRFLFGNPLEVTAVTGTYPGQPWDAESMAFYVLRYPDGLLAFGLDDGFPWTKDWHVRYRVEGQDAIAQGSIGWPTGGFSTLRYTTRQRPDSWQEPAFSRKWFPDAFVGTMGELFRAIETGDDPSISGEDNLDTLRLVEACYRSAAEKRTVLLEEIES